MSRGIQLKQLTGADLKLLGLSETSMPSAADADGIGSKEGGAPHASTENGARDPIVRGSGVPTEAPSRRAGPPSNPPLGPGQTLDAPREIGWQPLDLRRVARELCRELEVTLGLLEPAPGKRSIRDQAPG